MSDADFYAFHLEHMKQHFTTGGCGIRFFLDLWILNHSVKDKKEKKERKNWNVVDWQNLKMQSDR